MTTDDLCRRARAAADHLAGLPREEKDRVLERVAEALERRCREILQENVEDVGLAREARLPNEAIDRLYLDEERLAELARDMRGVAQLEDPVGAVERGWRLVNGLEVRERRAPFGVIGIVYETRPRTAVDAAAVCLKSGNALVLRGSTAAKHTDRILAEVVEGAALEAGLPEGSVAHLTTDPGELLDLLRRTDGLDLVVPLGGRDLQDYVSSHSAAPQLATGTGNCHIYVDAAADKETAASIVTSAKCVRPAGQTAVETLLVHGSAARACLPAILGELEQHGVEIVGDRATADLVPDIPVKRADRSHYETAFFRARLAVRIVSSLDEAVAHIREFSSGDADAIVTEDTVAARSFVALVDSACVFVNASTRFAEGKDFGFGVDLGVSTQKLHVRGPIGPRTLTVSKYVVWGDGGVHA